MGNTTPTVVNREVLAADYRDYMNNYLSLAVFAEHRGLTVIEAKSYLIVCRSCHDNKHPEA